MVRRLLGAGHQVSVFARRDDVRARLRDEGASLADSVADVAARSDILISCLFSDIQLRETGLGPEGFIANAKSGSVFVSHTTGTVATLTELSKSILATGDRRRPGERHRRAHCRRQTDRADRWPTGSGGAGAVDPGGLRRSHHRYGRTRDGTRHQTHQQHVVCGECTVGGGRGGVGRQLDVAPDALLQALSVCSGGSNAATYAQSAGGVDAFVSMAAPFLRKDVAAAVSAAELVGADLGFLRSVVETGPLSLAVGR